MSEILKNKDIVVQNIRTLKDAGTDMTESIATSGNDVPANAGIFAENWKPWEPDKQIAKAKSLWL